MIKEYAKSAISPILSQFRPGNIVMFHIGRCGSTVLSSMLNQHSKVFWASEFYSSIFHKWEKSADGKELIGQMPEDAIDLLKRHMKNALHRYYGFEIKPFHFKLIGYAMSSYLDSLKELGFNHMILLDRENRLRKIISSLLAHQDKNKYHQRGNKKPEKKQVFIDVDNVAIDYERKSLLSFLSDYDKEMSSLKELLKNSEYLNLIYEKDIQEDPRIGYKRVCEFIGLKPKNVTIKLSRTNPFSVREMIENFQDVETVLSGTAYEWMLYD